MTSEIPIYVIVRRTLLCTTSGGCKTELLAVIHETMHYFR